MLRVDGLKLVTIEAIGRYIAHKYGLYPEDPYEACLVDLRTDQMMMLMYVPNDDEVFTK
jgi:glutathione S-transferase